MSYFTIKTGKRLWVQVQINWGGFEDRDLTVLSNFSKIK